MSVWGMSVWVWVREEVRFYRFCESLGSTNIFIWIWKKICVDQQRYSRMHAYHIHREFHGSTYIDTDHQRLYGSTAVLMDPQRFLGIGKDFQGPETISGNPQIFS